MKSAYKGDMKLWGRVPCRWTGLLFPRNIHYSGSKVLRNGTTRDDYDRYTGAFFNIQG
jgi:hypothetical protein